MHLSWTANDLRGTFRFIRQQSSFLTSMLAVLALLITVVLYWLSVKARGRALRSLAGESPVRIQYEDLGAFALTVMTSLAVVTAVATTIVGLSHGWMFAPGYARLLAMLGLAVAGAALAAAVVISTVSWPGPRLIARREPAVGSLRRATIVVKGAIFIVVLAAAGPSFHSWTTARSQASQLAHWKRLSNQVALAFDAGQGEDGFEKHMPQVGKVVADAQSLHDVALSYAWRPDDIDESLDSYDALALVNPTWLDLVDPPLGAAATGTPTQVPPHLVPLDWALLPQGAQRYLTETLKIWAREPSGPSGEHISFYRVDSGFALPLALAGSGDLIYPKAPIVGVVSDVHSLNDSFLASAASSRNLVFTGLEQTQRLVTRHGLTRQVTVKYAAADEILLAQVTAYMAWLQGASLLALAVALAVAALVSAFIQAVMRARHDFPLRLAGATWTRIVGSRVMAEWLVGACLAVIVAAFTPGRGAFVALIAGVAALLVSPVAHVAASRWTFVQVRERRL